MKQDTLLDAVGFIVGYAININQRPRVDVWVVRRVNSITGVVSGIAVSNNMDTIVVLTVRNYFPVASSREERSW